MTETLDDQIEWLARGLGEATVEDLYLVVAEDIQPSPDYMMVLNVIRASAEFDVFDGSDGTCFRHQRKWRWENWR